MRWIGNFGRWCWRNHSQLLKIGALIVSFGVPAWAASVTPTMDHYAPFSWVGAGLLGCVVVAAAFWLFSGALAKVMLARRTATLIDKSQVNPLDISFERKVIRLSDFYHPHYLAHKNKDFRDCELTGPGLVLFLGAHIEGVEFKHIQVVILRSDKPISVSGVTAFENPKFVGGVFSNLTMLVDRKTYLKMPQDFRDHIPVINEQSQ